MTRIFTIKEGITHIEDLGLDKFLYAIDNLTKLDASEKMDGSELVFGLDDEGEFYSSRGAKGSKGLNYSTSEYLHGGGGPTFAAAHKVLKTVKDKIKQVMKSGEAVEIEVLYGRQPNAIIYGLNGLNYITFLRAVPGTNLDLEVRKDLTTQLTKILKDEKVTINSSFPMSTDGITIKKELVSSTWCFTKAPKVDISKVKNDDVKEEIEKLRTYLKASNEVASSVGLILSNFEIATVNLTNIPKEIRPSIKAERDQVNVKILSDFKLPIKEKLLKSFNKNIKPELQGEVKQGEVDGIEGIVFVDPETNEVFKLVDKDTFTSINQFNFMIRKKLFSVVRSVDPDASLEARGGIVGRMKFRIMSLLGIPEATRNFNLKKLLADLDGENPDDTLAKFALGYQDVNENAFRQKITAIIQSTIDEVNDTLDDFKKNNGTFKLKLKNGKEIGYTDEIIRRTLLTFAEVREYLSKYKMDIAKTRSIKDLLAAIVGNTVERIHDGSLTESVKHKKGTTMLIQEIAKLTEDGEEGGSTVAASTTSAPTSTDSLLSTVTKAGDIASVPMRLFKGKIIRRIPRKIAKRKRFAKTKSAINK